MSTRADTILDTALTLPPDEPHFFVALAMIQQMPDGRVHFEYTGVAGNKYIIQASTNLVQWENLSTNTTAGLVSFTDSSSTNRHHRFYRVQTAP